MSVPENVLDILENHLERFVGARRADWLFPGDEGRPISPRTLDRMWTKARKAVGRTDVHLHDLRHSGLTWAATTGASTAELMHRAGHRSHVAAVRYQHMTADRDRVLADALADLANGRVVDLRRTKDGRSPEEAADAANK